MRPRLPGPQARREALRDLAAGMAVALGQAPLGLWPVALAGMALVIVRLARAASPAAAFRRGWLAGAGHFGLALSWIVQPFLVDPWRHGWMAPFALLFIAFGLGLFWGAAGWLARWIGGGPVAVALAWSGAELLRGHVLTGFPWALPGHVWAETPLSQLASLTGANGMTALTLLALAVPLQWKRAGWGLTLALLALAGGWSWHRLSLPEPPARPALVRIVQPAIPQTLKWDRDEARANFDILLGLTAGGRADLTVWPETAVPYAVTPGEGAAALIAGAAGGRPVVAGYQRDEGARAWNSLGVIGPGGSIGQVYDKMHLVPFGEYIPSGDLVFRWTGLRAFASQAGAGYSAGGRRVALDLGPALGRAAPLICYESIFPDEAATTPRADWMLLVTNDAWFGNLTGPYQHFAQARLRAIEQGLPLLRAANTGISAVIDGRGRLARGTDGRPAVLGMGQRGAIEARLPGALRAPPYARMGDGPLALLLAAGLVACGLRGRHVRGA